MVVVASKKLPAPGPLSEDELTTHRSANRRRPRALGGLAVNLQMTLGPFFWLCPVLFSDGSVNTYLPKY